MAINSEVLITLVEARPVLWDKTLENYKDRNLTRNAWSEVCIELNSGFEELGDEEKNSFGKEVIRRWTNIRDAFAKAFKKKKESKFSGSAANRLKQYVYHDELKFLKKLYTERETSNSLSEDDGCVEIENVVEQQRLVEPDEINSEIFKKPSATRKHKKVDAIELQILKALEPKEQEKPDPNMSFFQSLLPHLYNFNAEEILQFQMGVLQVISNLNEKRKRTVHPPQYSQQTYYYDPSHLAHPSFTQHPPFHNQPANQMSQQYHSYIKPQPFKQFSQSPAVSSQSQPVTTGTISKNSPLAHHSSLSYTCTKTPLFSKNNDSSILDERTECHRSVDQCNTDFFRSETTNSGVSSPESITSSTYSGDFVNF